MKKFDFVIDTERFGKNFQAEFSLSEDFLKNLEKQMIAAKELKIWRLVILDRESENNMEAGYAALSAYSEENIFPISGVLSFEGGLYYTGARDEDGEDVQDGETYFFDFSMDKEFNLFIRPK